MHVREAGKKKNIWRDGYHMGVVGGTLAAATVLLLNLFLTIGVAAKHEFQGGFGILQQGDCDETKRLDLWLHLLINVLGTLLLGASNYGMQCLSAPTREELDAAHLQGKWMDIGVPSIRNLASIAPWRKVLWSLLLLSSVPLHLLYNSVVFSSTSFAEWQALAVTDDFLSGAVYSVHDGLYTNTPGYNMVELLDRLRDSKSLVRLDNEACIQAYTPALQSSWSYTLVVTSQTGTNNSFLNLLTANIPGENSNLGFCGLLPAAERVVCEKTNSIDPNNWTLNAPDKPKVAHCMALPAQAHCEVRFSIDLMIVVLVCNVIKVLCLGVVALRTSARPLVTLGDAIASLLERPGQEISLLSLSGLTRGAVKSLTFPSKSRV